MLRNRNKGYIFEYNLKQTDMYDSLITLIQMLDNSDKLTCIKITSSYIAIDIGMKRKIFKYNQASISKAIEELEDLL